MDLVLKLTKEQKSLINSGTYKPNTKYIAVIVDGKLNLYASFSSPQGYLRKVRSNSGRKCTYVGITNSQGKFNLL